MLNEHATLQNFEARTQLNPKCRASIDARNRSGGCAAIRMIVRLRLVVNLAQSRNGCGRPRVNVRFHSALERGRCALNQTQCLSRSVVNPRSNGRSALAVIYIT